jgi:hypothetical protein
MSMSMNARLERTYSHWESINPGHSYSLSRHENPKTRMLVVIRIIAAGATRYGRVTYEDLKPLTLVMCRSQLGGFPI